MAAKKQPPMKFPPLTFSGTGAVLTQKQLSRVGGILDLPQSCLDYLAWRNGGVPSTGHFDWNVSSKRKRTSRIDSLFGVDCRLPVDKPERRLDIFWAITRFRHWLPRWSVPLGFVDDDWFLITFTTYDERAGQIWLKEWQHDVPDDTVNPEKRIHFIANSFVAFANTWYDSVEDDADE
jgi:hypothetical protein